MKNIPQLPEKTGKAEANKQGSDGASTGAAKSAQQGVKAKPRKPNNKSKRAKKASMSQQKRNAREKALQALYQWEMSDAQAYDVRKEFLENQEMGRVDTQFFELLFNGVAQDPDAIDESLSAALDRPIADLDPIERNVMRICVFEMQQCLETPVRVVINEGIEITKRFGADQGHKYVNGVLDKLAMQLRTLEMQR